MPFKILLVGQSAKRLWWDELKAAHAEWSLAATSNTSETAAYIRNEAPQAVVIDLEWPEIAPLNFFRQFAETPTPIKFIGITHNNSLRLAVEAIKAGFHEVIDLSAEAAKLQKELSKLAEHWQAQQQGENLHQQQKTKFDYSRLIGNSPVMQQICEILSKVAGRKWVNVLVRGETGTGKELIARTLHYNSFSQFQPFVEINCSAIPENLLESELFGYEKGAFTDAKARKKGLFELAENGTLFLDEIGEISMSMQVKLLKVIEEKKIRRLGGTEEIHVNTRIIAATNRDLSAAIRDGRFRQDLFYRLNVISIYLPALRERGDDVMLLARHFLVHYAKEYENGLTGFAPEAEALLKSHHWPGNVRELQHTIERIVLLADGQHVTREALAEAIESDTPSHMSEKNQTTTVKIEIPPEGMSLDDGEQKLILAVLKEMHWNKRRTCHALKISRPRLDRKIEKYNLKIPASNGNDTLP